MTQSTIMPTVGGVLIGLGSLLALTASGKIPGISGVLGRVLRPQKGDIAWRWLFLLGLVGGAALAFQLGIGWRGYSIPDGRGIIVLIVAGLLVGFGTRLGAGCTSGHGVCGIGAGAKDSIFYTIIFMLAGIITVFIWNLIIKSI